MSFLKKHFKMLKMAILGVIFCLVGIEYVVIVYKKFVDSKPGCEHRRGNDLMPTVSKLYKGRMVTFIKTNYLYSNMGLA